MTLAEISSRPPTTSRRSELELLHDQLAGIQAWLAAHREGDDARGRATSREALLDQARRLDVLRRQRAALVDWTDRSAGEGTGPLMSACECRAVVVHRNAWFRTTVSEGLEAAGVRVVAQLENGADAVGVAVAEQPDLLLVEDRLPMLGGLDVVRQVRAYAPRTVSAAQVAYDEDLGPVLDAGARTAFSRRVPPAEVARELALLLPV